MSENFNTTIIDYTGDVQIGHIITDYKQNSSEKKLVLDIISESVNWGKDHGKNDTSCDYRLLVTNDKRLISYIESKNKEIIKLENILMIEKIKGTTIEVNVQFQSKNNFKKQFPNARWDSSKKKWTVINVTENQILELYDYGRKVYRVSSMKDEYHYSFSYKDKEIPF